MNELQHEQKVERVSRAVERARRKYATQVIRLYETLVGVPLKRLNTTPRRHGPADFSDFKKRRARGK